MKKFLVPTVVLFFILTSCSSSDGSSAIEKPESGQTTSTEENQIQLTLAEVSNTGGCLDYSQSAEFAPFATEWGLCTFEDAETQAYEFPNQAAVDEFFKTVSGFGIVPEQTAIASQADGRVFVWAPKDATKLVSLKKVFSS